MGESNKLGYAYLEIGGIQNYILSSGKLKEMIGGSELVEQVFKDVLEDVATSLGYSFLRYGDKDFPKVPDDKLILVTQLNAGAAFLLFSSEENAKDLLHNFSIKVTASYPGLPFFGALTQCEWTQSSLNQARRDLQEKIRVKRALRGNYFGMQMQPFCTVSNIDGLPAVAKDKDDLISVVSRTKRDPEFIKKSKERLRSIEISPREFGFNADSWIWEDDLAKMVGGEQNRVALVHMDGNDLGRLFIDTIENIKNDSSMTLEKSICKMSALSALVEDSNSYAFKKAVSAVLHYMYDLKKDEKVRPVVPLRPLVLGGDDVTVLIRADMALIFTNVYVKAFEYMTGRIAKENPLLTLEDNFKLSLGVGMVVCSTSYPFSKAFALAEELIENAKNHTASGYKGVSDRPSSIDYLIISNDLEDDLKELRRHLFTTNDGLSLTGKPFLLIDNFLENFLRDALQVAKKFSRGTLRGLLSEVRFGKEAADKAYDQQIKNLSRGVGGRNNPNSQTDLSEDRSLGIFRELFPKSFFDESGSFTYLGDYLEVEKLLPVGCFEKENSDDENQSNRYIDALKQSVEEDR